MTCVHTYKVEQQFDQTCGIETIKEVVASMCAPERDEDTHCL